MRGKGDRHVSGEAPFAPFRQNVPVPFSARATGDAKQKIRVVRGTGFSEGQAREVLAAHDRALASAEGVLKNGRRTAVTRVAWGEQSATVGSPTVATAGQASRGTLLCVKEYRPTGLLDRLRIGPWWPRARRAWSGAARLAARGVAIPELLALLERGATAYLVARFIEGAVPLNRLVLERFAGAGSREEVPAKRSMMRQLGHWLRGVHDRGVYHDDWSAKNILALQSGGEWAFYFLDFESVAPLKPLTYRRRVKNLSQIGDAPAGVTRTDKMRFLLAYAKGDKALTRGRFPRDVLAATQRRQEARERAQAPSRSRKTSG
jgi:hypothetical protein